MIEAINDVIDKSKPPIDAMNDPSLGKVLVFLTGPEG
jgi:hypothetical protein